MIAMVIFEIAGNYIIWHYSKAIRNIVSIWWDLEWFLWNYFSISRLFKTFFVPWKRLGESTNDYFDLAAILSSIVVTTLMRLLGVVIRFITIIVGILLMVLLVPLLVISLIVWIAMPAIVALIFLLGVAMLTQKF